MTTSLLPPLRFPTLFLWCLLQYPPDWPHHLLLYWLPKPFRILYLLLLFQHLLSYPSESLLGTSPGNAATKSKTPLQFRIISDYHSNEVLRIHLRCVYGLPFIPLTDVIDAWTELKAVIWTCCPTQAMSKYITYWIFSSSCPPSLWNCCAATLDGDPQTNNASERGNNTQTRNNFEQSLHLVLRANYPGIKFWDGAEASPHLAEHRSWAPQRPRWRFREETIKRLVETYNWADKVGTMRLKVWIF